VDLHVLGAGRVRGTVERRRPISYHGIPGMAWRLTVRLPGGGTAEALQVGGGRPRFADPRVRPA
jgi:hypothetical protein